MLALTVPAAEAATYYVATDGDDANSGTLAQPFRTLGQGVRGLSPGDTLSVRAGTYIGSSQLASIPGGNSWAAPVTIAAYPGETVTLVAATDDFVASFYNTQYVILDGFVMDATGGWDGLRMGASAHHIRIQNCEIKHAPYEGMLIGGNDNEFINLKLHDNGTDFPRSDGSGEPPGHGIYIGSKRNLLEGSEVYRNGGWGVHVFNTPGGADNNVVRNNRIYDNGQSGRGVGMILSEGDGNAAYNNILWGNRRGGIMVAYSVSNTNVYNNTIYANGLADPGNSIGGIYVADSSAGAIVRNNIVYGNAGGDITDGGSNTTLSHNLTTDSKFVNPAAGDFHLTSGSPAIDAGVSLADVPTDFDGTPRPQGSGYDMGAYEFKVGGILPGDLNKDGKRDLTDVRLLIYMLIGQQPKTPEVDLTGEGAVTLADLQALIKLMVGLP